MRWAMRAYVAGCAAVLIPWPTSASEHKRAAPFTSSAERCIVPASNYHGVNPYVLRAILVVESGLNPSAMAKNRNGTLDLGMGQMNSIHFQRLAKHGIAPSHLLDACVATYVAAWHLREVMDQNGNTWIGIAKYHSQNPYFNRRYQILLYNELVRVGAVQGRKLPVPPLTGQSARSAPKPVDPSTPPLVVYDQGHGNPQ